MTYDSKGVSLSFLDVKIKREIWELILNSEDDMNIKHTKSVNFSKCLKQYITYFVIKINFEENIRSPFAPEKNNMGPTLITKN